MTAGRRLSIAFYAPLKAPDHPVPSGDREMARLLVQALRHAGHEVSLASGLRSFSAGPEPQRWHELEAEAAREARDIAAGWHDGGPPGLWFTYHNHYKAPDLLGPGLTRTFDLPYVIAEASHSARRAAAWGAWAALADAATARADLHVCFTARDREGLAPLLRPEATVLDLPPFIDSQAWPQPSRQAERAGPTTLLAVAMMRPGDKLRSYRFLAEALGHLSHAEWRLRVVGDGPARDAVRAAFSGVPADRLTWLGQLDPAAIAAEMTAADVLAWPGFGEAFGLSYLEAQSQALPVVALDTAGVAAVVRHDETGLLVRVPEPQAYADALRSLLDDRAKRRRLGASAAAWVHRERTLGSAFHTLDLALRQVVACEDRARAG